jgi:NAD(P)-dependent dehydrogenase (short-subunit alcohol dehydrogenase family)
MTTDQSPTTGKAVLDRNPNKYLSRSVQDLLSLKGRTIVITGGGRGLGLAFAFAIAEAGGNVAIIDLLDKPHDHFHKLESEFDIKAKLYKLSVPGERLAPVSGISLSSGLLIGRHRTLMADLSVGAT